ncbi:hypothetical protein CMUS01_03725 [Colletotrichum musicola]|uniref:Uncharacterized protein n=1 Tax=Colletotrichum musicola TaxID=2175873 RepID=A0A8H6U5T2_9PEZI|nr:hypothetical protein CMUS01_03725 [Colletotrichum musicola]
MPVVHLARSNLILGRYLPTHDHEKRYPKFLLAGFRLHLLEDRSVANIKSPSARPQRRPSIHQGSFDLSLPNESPPRRSTTSTAPRPPSTSADCSALAIPRILSPAVPSPGLLAFASSDDMRKAFASLTSPHPAAPAITGPSSLRQECFTPVIIPDAARRSRPFPPTIKPCFASRLCTHRVSKHLDSVNPTRPSERCSPPPSHDRPTCPQRRVMGFSPRPLAECRTSPVNPESVDDPWDRPDPGHGKDTSDFCSFRASESHGFPC